MYVIVHFCLMTVIHAQSEVKVVHVGSTVKFSCDTTDVEDIVWEFTSSSYSSQTFVVYEYPNITYKFMSRFFVSDDGLSINNVQLCDAGNYRRSFPSENNLGTKKIELVILGK